MTVGHEYVGEGGQPWAMVLSAALKSATVYLAKATLPVVTAATCRAGRRHLCRNTTGVLASTVQVHSAEYLVIPAEKRI